MRRTYLTFSAVAVRDVLRVTAWHSAGRLDLNALEQKLVWAKVPNVTRISPVPQGAKPSARSAAHDDVLIFSVADRASDVSVPRGPLPLLDALMKPTPEVAAGEKKTFVVFGEGGIVGWNASTTDFAAVWAESKTSGEVPLHNLTESAKYTVTAAAEGADEAEHASAVDADPDMFVLSGSSDLQKLPFSYALAQSVKIDVLDLALRPVLQQVKKWEHLLSSTGKLECNVKQLRQTKTNLLMLFEEVNVTTSVQTTPRIFWTPQFQRYRGVYKAVRTQLEVEDRLEYLQDKVETVNESLDYLHGEVHTETNEFLTWVIIWLIVVEIVLALGVHNHAATYMRSALEPAAVDRESDAEASA